MGVSHGREGVCQQKADHDLRADPLGTFQSEGLRGDAQRDSIRSRRIVKFLTE